MKQFCETSSFFEVDNIKNERILWEFLQKWKVACRADGLVPMRFAIFPVHLSKLLRLPRKSDARSYEVLHLSRKIISANLKIWSSKKQPLSGNHRPDLLTALMKMSLVLPLPRKMHLCRSSSNVPRLPSFLDMLQNPQVLLTFDKVHNPVRLPRESTSEPPRVARTCGVLMCRKTDAKRQWHPHFQSWRLNCYYLSGLSGYTHTQASTHNSVRHRSFTRFVFHHLLSRSCLFHPIFTSALCLLEEVDMWGSFRPFNFYRCCFKLSWSTVIDSYLYMCINTVYIYILIYIYILVFFHYASSCRFFLLFFACQMHLNIPLQNSSEQVRVRRAEWEICMAWLKQSPMP